jgi:multisubunit Na+/H+ antiporter MnhF subunit
VTASGFFGLCVGIGLAMTSLALALGFVRLLKGPTLADRVVALDLVTMLLVVTLTLFAMWTGEAAYLDAALPLALVAFLATVAFARYIDRAPRDAGAPASPRPAAAEPRAAEDRP